MVFQRLDLWVGKTLFVPLIVRLCHALRVSQQWVDAHANAVGWLLTVGGYCSNWSKLETWWGTALYVLLGVLLTLCTIGSMARAWLKPELKRVSLVWFRVVCLAFLMQNVIAFTLGLIVLGKGPGFWGVVNTCVWWLWLFAEYAATIDKLPPRKKREAKVAGRLAREGV